MSKVGSLFVFAVATGRGVNHHAMSSGEEAVMRRGVPSVVSLRARSGDSARD